MWFAIVLVLLGLAYAGYRISLAVRAGRATRSGEHERAEAFRSRGSRLFLAVFGLMALAALVLGVVVIATHG